MRCSLLDHEVDLSHFDARFRNDTTYSPAVSPADSLADSLTVLLKVVLFAS